MRKARSRSVRKLIALIAERRQSDFVAVRLRKVIRLLQNHLLNFSLFDLADLAAEISVSAQRVARLTAVRAIAQGPGPTDCHELENAD